VAGAAEALGAANGEIAAARRAGALVVYTQDWHPPDTPHFEKDGGIWPVHCVAGTWGAELHPGLLVEGDMVKKGVGGEDGYSGFTVRHPVDGTEHPTPLDGLLRSHRIERVVVVGLATDYCVKETALDARRLGYPTEVIGGAVRAVDLRPGDGDRALDQIREAGGIVRAGPGPWVGDADLGLFTDLYELTMAAAYLRSDLTDPATFDLFVRRLPPDRNYLVAAGVDDAIDHLDRVRFDDAALAYLESLAMFDTAFLDYLAGFRFSGDVAAVEEGEVVYAGEPLLRVTAPVIEAQIVETLLLNTVGFQTMVASKAARMTTAAGTRSFVDFSARRDQGADAALKAARAAYLAGAAGTSLVLAGRHYGIPVAGTMAHSFVMAFESETEAFERFARAFPESAVLLIDTYDTEEGARRAARVATDLAAEGVRVQGVRLDSGDLAALARRVRAILDDAGHPSIEIIASGDLDEARISDLVAGGAPIDSFGVGTRLGTSADYPFLDVVYKLVDVDGSPRLKLSPGKTTVPGRKQVYRFAGPGARDVVALEGESIVGGRPLLAPVMTGGRRRVSPAPLEKIRRRVGAALAGLPEDLRSLGPATAPYDVVLSPAVSALITGRADR
jgi:nicotinate phosphoribosyltransferase